MARVKGGVVSRRRHKKVLKATRGYRGSRSTLYRSAVRVLRRAWLYAFRDRRVFKRTIRGLWIQRVNAASRLHGLRYSELMNGLKKANINLNRKQLSELAINDEAGFAQIVEAAKKALNKKAA